MYFIFYKWLSGFAINMVTIGSSFKVELHKSGSINYSIVTSTHRLQASTNYWLDASCKGHFFSTTAVYAAVWKPSEDPNAGSTKQLAPAGSPPAQIGLVIATVGAHSSSHRLRAGSFSPQFHPLTAPPPAVHNSCLPLEGRGSVIKVGLCSCRSGFLNNYLD